MSHETDIKSNQNKVNQRPFGRVGAPDTITWLHLSDLHFQTNDGSKWDSDIVLRKLLDDLEVLNKKDGLSPDLILVSGDITYSSQNEEFALASSFFDDLLNQTGLQKQKLFLAPGNHDINRRNISLGAQIITSNLKNKPELWVKALNDKLDRRLIMRKFDNYAGFVKDYFGDHGTFDDEKYFFVHRLELAGKRIAVMTLNSAWLAFGGHQDNSHLALGEQQIVRALEDCQGAELCIALQHHPFSWLNDADAANCKSLLMKRCYFILCGHLHRPMLGFQETPDAKAMFISAGSCYENRQHQNSYNMVKLDLKGMKGTVFLRAWSNIGSGIWSKDLHAYEKMTDGYFNFPIVFPSF